MRSLYHHEHLSHEYLILPDEELNEIGIELIDIRDTSKVPRQVGRASLLLERLLFEVEQRFLAADNLQAGSDIVAI